MTAAKIAISLPRELVTHVRGEVQRGRAASVSAYVASAVAKQAENDDLTEMLDEMLAASGGPMTRAERAWADGVLGVRGKRKR
jgi:Arc/MetJ-type ribon-helix-helix transcriptional regulator